jgi:hypothetical protein
MSASWNKNHIHMAFLRTWCICGEVRFEPVDRCCLHADPNSHLTLSSEEKPQFS